jgi:hypothetical protein
MSSRRRTTSRLGVGAAAGALAVAGMTLAMAGDAYAVAPGRAAWFNQLAVAPSPAPAPPGLSTGSELEVGGSSTGATAITTLDYTVDPATPSAVLTLQIAPNGVTGTPTVDVCPVTSGASWTAGTDQPKASTPGYTCPTTTVMGTVNGSTITFSLGAPVRGDYDLALVPDAASMPFDLVLDAPDASSLAAASPTSSSTSPAAAPAGAATTSATPASDSSGSSGGSSGLAGSSGSGGSFGSAGSPDASTPFAGQGNTGLTGSGAATPGASAGGSFAGLGALPVALPSTPAVSPLPTPAASASGVANSGAGHSSGGLRGTGPTKEAVAPAASLHPASSDYLVGAIGLGVLLLGLLFGATRDARPARLLGSLSIGSLRTSEDAVDGAPVEPSAPPSYGPGGAPGAALRRMLNPRPPRLLGSLSISSLKHSADEGDSPAG